MKNPSQVNLQTRGEVRAAGWKAESRDDDGHLCTTHAAFDDDKAIIQYVREALASFHTVTIWPHKIAAKSDYFAWGSDE